MKKLPNKKSLLALAGISIFVLLIFFVVYDFFLARCGSNIPCAENMQAIARLDLSILLPLVFFCLFLLVTYKMPESIFYAWIKFAIWAAPLLMIINFISSKPPSLGSLGIGNGLTAAYTIIGLAILSAAFVVISLAIIAIKYFTLRRAK